MGDIVFFLLGAVLLSVGADLLVRGGSNLAQRLGVSPIAVGLTIVAYGTSLPELIVTSTASLAGSPDVAIGNVFGSNICNVALILGVGALLKPLKVHDQVVRREVPLLFLVSLIVVAFLANNIVGRAEGLALLAAGILFTVGLYQRARRGAYNVADEVPAPHFERHVAWDVVMLVAGLVALFVGGEWFVDGAVGLARAWGVSERVIGLSMVALGTSMPELVTVVVSILRGQDDLGIGNLVGSNFFNLTIVLGGAATVQPVPFGGGTQWADIGLALLLPVVFLPLLGRGSLVVGRARGTLLVSGYAAYLVLLAVTPG